MVDQQRINNKRRNEKQGIHINSEIGQFGRIKYGGFFTGNHSDYC